MLYFGIQQIESNLLAPRVIGRSAGIHPVILMPLMIILSQFDPLWIILAAPLAAIVRDLFRYAYGRLDDPPRPAGLLPGDPVFATPNGGPVMTRGRQGSRAQRSERPVRPLRSPASFDTLECGVHYRSNSGVRVCLAGATCCAWQAAEPDRRPEETRDESDRRP